MDLPGRVVGIFSNPRRTFGGLSARPVWIDALVVVLLALIAFNLAVLPYAQKDNLSLIRDNAALKERMGEDIYAKLIDRTEHPSRLDQVVKLFVATPLFFLAGLLLQSLLLLILGRFVSTQGTYLQALSALVHASLIDKLLGNALRLGLALSRGSVMQTSTSLALLFPRMEATSTPYIMLTQVDFFQLWLFGVLAIGLSSIFKIAPRKALAISYGVWVLKALANIIIGLIGMSFLK